MSIVIATIMTAPPPQDAGSFVLTPGVKWPGVSDLWHFH